MVEKNEIVIFEAEDKSVTLNVAVEDETVWLTQNDMTKLFERDQSVISRHLKNVFKEEVDEKVICIFCILQIQISQWRFIVLT